MSMSYFLNSTEVGNVFLDNFGYMPVNFVNSARRGIRLSQFFLKIRFFKQEINEIIFYRFITEHKAVGKNFACN